MRYRIPFIAFGALALSLSHAAVAQQIPAPALETGHTLLTINANGSTASAPDLAIFNAGVTTQAPTAVAALAENSTKMTAVIKALKAAGIAERDIQTSNLQINPVYSDPERAAMIAARAGQPYVPPAEPVRTIVAYNVVNNVMVRQRNLKEFGRVIDTLVKAGANQVNGPNFQLDDQEQALNDARREAMVNARKKAELYAQAAGLRIVRILSISESGGYYQPRAMFRTYAADAVAAPPPPAPMQPGELDLNASVTVLYELAP